MILPFSFQSNIPLHPFLIQSICVSFDIPFQQIVK
jgi:hypothetical protein